MRRLAPDPNLAEGYPPAHRIPYSKGALADGAREVHVEGARMEAAYRALVYRGWPPDPPDDGAGGGRGDGAAEVASDGAAGAATAPGKLSPRASKPPRVSQHEYDIVVCHGNVIRYMALRALQLPPEAWLRLCTYNCSLTHLKIRPTGSVSMISLGDTGHLSLDETSFSMHAGYEW